MTQKTFECRNCKRKIQPHMEIEYSAHLTEFFCSPDCARNHYFEIMRSIPVEYENMKDV